LVISLNINMLSGRFIHNHALETGGRGRGYPVQGAVRKAVWNGREGQWRPKFIDNAIVRLLCIIAGNDFCSRVRFDAQDGCPTLAASWLLQLGWDVACRGEAASQILFYAGLRLGDLRPPKGNGLPRPRTRRVPAAGDRAAEPIRGATLQSPGGPTGTGSG